jgi:hypothetical protein
VNTRATEALRKPPESPSEATEQPGRVGPQPAVEAPGSPETAAEETIEPTPSEPSGGPQRAPERPWWRRVFGG